MSILDELKQINSISIKKNMPVVKPIPIDTKNINFFKKYWRSFQPRKWELIKDFIIPIKYNCVIIPKGFVFDFASIPRALWGIMSPTGILLSGSVPHDFGYRYKGLLIKTPNQKIYFEEMKKSEIDDVFYTISKKVNDMTALPWIAEKMVNTFGWIAWHQNRKEKLNVFNSFPELNISKRIIKK